MERGGGEMMDLTPEEVVGSKDLSNVMKGKRTKRQRPQSPIPFTIIAPSTSDNGNPNTNNSSSSNSNNNTAFSVTTSTDEDEDTARCLILLAQGQSREWPRTTIKESFVAPKFNSKRYIETPIAANGKAGMYVYECKTCSKTFPSFQALGGHRASHKKPRAMAEEKKPLAVMSDEEEEESNWRNNVSYSSLSLQLSARGGNCGNSSIVKSNSKVHECSICGTEFASGQALGGHMRRHRAVVGGGNNGLSLSPTSQVSMDVPAEELTRKRRNAFSLDLNLPAPEDDHHRDNNKLTFASKQRQNQQQQQQQQQSSALVLSAATNLVDCHF